MPAHDRERCASARASLDGCELIVDGTRYRYLAFNEPAPVRLKELTRAEQDVAERAASGQSSKEISRARGTSTRTVDHQLARVFRKLQVANRHELCERLFQTPGPP